MSTSTLAVSPRQRSIGNTASNGSRERLIASLPVTETNLILASIDTTVFSGGEGRPIVLLHGPGEHALKWLRVMPELMTSYRVIAADLPGHGTSEGIEGMFTPDRLVTWLGDLIDKTCINPPILVGQIVGGAIAAHFAARHSDRLASLVLADSLGLAPFQPAPDFAAALMAYIVEPSADNHDGLWQKCAFDLDTMRLAMGDRWDWLRAYNLDRASDPTLKPTQQRLMELFAFPPILPELLTKIEVPTILIWGRHDLATPLSVAEAASSTYGWPLHVIDGAGDDPAMEQPSAFVNVLRTTFSDPWDRIALGYDRTNTETQIHLGNEAVHWAELRPAMRFLDVASGSGALSIPAARMGADVTAIDASPTMLRLLRKRADSEGIDIETQVMNGHALSFADDTFDMVGSQFGVMVFPDMPQGIREMARVVKPGGRVLVVAYGDPLQIEFLRFFVSAVQAVRPDFTGPPMDPVPLPFQLSDPRRLAQHLEAAGLNAIRVEQVLERTSFTTGSELWEWILYSNPIAKEILDLLQLGEGEISRIIQRLETLVSERAKLEGVAILSNPINLAIATK